MKNLFLISLFSLFLFANATAQEGTSKNSNYSFIEWNVGVALTTYHDVFSGTHGVFPGTSVLLGKTHINSNNIILEYEMGLAAPTIITGKVGIGKQFKYAKAIVGVRPFPFNLFIQSSFNSGERGYWIASAEYNPLEPDLAISVASKAVLNIGYRWHLSKN